MSAARKKSPARKAAAPKATATVAPKAKAASKPKAKAKAPAKKKAASRNTTLRVSKKAAVEESKPFVMTAPLEAEVDELITHYPQKRSAMLMVLHAIQSELGWISKEAIVWTATKLELQPINVYEVVTFYPMFNDRPVGKFHLKVCRTLSCAMGGSHQLYSGLCEKLGLDSTKQGQHTTADGKFTVDFSECLASCGTAPVMMCNDDFHEAVSDKDADDILKKCE
jgi:NADH-quinone oxidoreductase subunit E